MFKRIAALVVVGFVLLGAGPPNCKQDAVEDALKAAPSSALQPTPMPGSSDINFLTVCLFSHRAADDPIVAPNLPGGSHSHDFFGNRSTNNSSTYDSLVANRATTCNRTGDTAAYWAPSLLIDGQILQPQRINAYYRTGGKPAESIQAFPAGLKVVAGNSKATAPQDIRVVSWGCASADGGPQPSTTPLTCPFDGKQGGLKLRIRFMDCWDGVNLDSADHASHMAYSKRGACPATHPVPVPQITMNVVYPTTGGPSAVLASGNSPYTGHADFFNAWDQATLQTLVANCLNASVHCGAKGGGVPLHPRRR
jgi:hypothetical protein